MVPVVQLVGMNERERESVVNLIPRGFTMGPISKQNELSIPHTIPFHSTDLTFSFFLTYFLGEIKLIIFFSLTLSFSSSTQT